VLRYIFLCFMVIFKFDAYGISSVTLVILINLLT
jgi:hypothetical protein